MKKLHQCALGGNFVPHFPKREDCEKKVEDPWFSAIVAPTKTIIKRGLAACKISILKEDCIKQSYSNTIRIEPTFALNIIEHREYNKDLISFIHIKNQTSLFIHDKKKILLVKIKKCFFVVLAVLRRSVQRVTWSISAALRLGNPAPKKRRNGDDPLVTLYPIRPARE